MQSKKTATSAINIQIESVNFEQRGRVGKYARAIAWFHGEEFQGTLDERLQHLRFSKIPIPTVLNFWFRIVKQVEPTSVVIIDDLW